MIIQQKRNNTIHTSLADAKKYLNDYVTKNKATIKDGEILFTRYFGGGEKVGALRSYTLRGVVNATNPSQPYVEFDDVNNDNIVRENLLYYSYGLVGSGGWFKAFKYFEPSIIRGSQIRSDRAFTFSFELLPSYYSSTPDNKKVYFVVENKTTNQTIPIKLVDKGYSYITQDDSRILFTIKESECKTKERLSVTFTIDDMKLHTSYGDVVSFRMYVGPGESSIEYMRNPKLELGYEMTDYNENNTMKEKYLYAKSIKYTKDATTALIDKINALHTPKYNYNNIEVKIMKTQLLGSYGGSAFFEKQSIPFNVAYHDTSGCELDEIKNIYYTENNPKSLNNIFLVFPALKVKGYNDEKLYLNGYGVDVIYYKYDIISKQNKITAIKTDKKQQCVLTKYDESGGYSYYRIIDSNISDISGNTPLACIPVDILFNTNTSPRPFMIDSSGKIMYPKIVEQEEFFVKNLYFTSEKSLIIIPDFEIEMPDLTPPVKPIDWNELPKDDPSTPWKEGFVIP